MNILYNHWNYLSDKPGISSPDGGAVYVPWIFNELISRGHKVYCGPINRDKEIVERMGKEAFSSFSQEKRWEAYKNLEFVDLHNLPKLDMLVLEWRFPTRDNQLSIESPGYSPDLRIQQELISHYQKDKIPIVLFDLDHKLTLEDEAAVKPMKVLETALHPKLCHTSVFIPFDFSEILQFPMWVPSTNNHLVYVGNNYERDFDFNTKIVPYAKKHPRKVHLIGNWLKDAQKLFRDANLEIQYHDRIGFDKFREAYRLAVAVPLLAKDEYKKRGFMTARLIESLLWGSLPIGFSDFYGIENSLPSELIVDVKDPKDMERKMTNLLNVGLGYAERLYLRDETIRKIKPLHDASVFVDKLLEVKNAS